MEEETKFQVYDLGGEELLVPHSELREVFEELRELQYKRAWNYVEELPEFKITKLSQEEISQLGEEELAKYTLKAETTLSKAYSIGMVQQDKVGGVFGLSFAIDNQHAKDRATQHAGEMISGINETTKKEINGLLNQAFNNQLSKKELLEKLQTSFAFSKYRANMIANNEVGTAYIQWTVKQHQELMKRTGIEGRKYRQTSNDSKVSDLCMDNQNQDWIPFNQDFFSGHFCPLGHVNCRCKLRVRPFKPWELPDGILDHSKDRAWNGLPENYDQLSNNVLPPNFWKAGELPKYQLSGNDFSSFNPAKNTLTLGREKWSLNQKIDELHEAGHWLHYKAIMQSPTMQKRREEIQGIMLKEIDGQIDVIKKWNGQSFEWIKTAYQGKIKEYVHYYRYEQTIGIAGKAQTTIELSQRLELDSLVVLDMIDGIKKGEMNYETHEKSYLEKHGEKEAVANMNVIAHTKNKVFEEYFPNTNKAIKQFYSDLYEWLKY